MGTKLQNLASFALVIPTSINSAPIRITVTKFFLIAIKYNGMFEKYGFFKVERWVGHIKEATIIRY